VFPATHDEHPDGLRTACPQNPITLWPHANRNQRRQRPRGRYDTIGPTIYLADSHQCAYAEVLLGFRQQRAAMAKAAESIGWSMQDCITSVRAQAQENRVDVPWVISVDWRMHRSIYEIRIPCRGWWVQIVHPGHLKQ
jgi:hypothetical protein